LTPRPEESLAFFRDILGMEVESQAGQSVFLRGWGDYQRYSLILTESDAPGMAWMGLRAWDGDALRRRPRSIAEGALGLGRAGGGDAGGHEWGLYNEGGR